eukprot:jgi/Chlat1/5094/Chrsp33S05020
MAAAAAAAAPSEWLAEPGGFCFGVPPRTRRKSRQLLSRRAVVRASAAASQEPGQGSDEVARRAVVVGGGWAGFGAAHQLFKHGFQVTLVDAADNPGGLSSGFRTANGRPVEAGIKGFWYQYHNIYALMDELQLVRNRQRAVYRLDSKHVLFASRHSGGITNLPGAPPFASTAGESGVHKPILQAWALLNLPLLDRLSALPLLRALLEFDVDEATYNLYDKMTARELFRTAGVSKRLYDDFLQPILLVTLFAPAEKLSASAALGALYYYVLAHQADFDVRWCKGSVAERIFTPWVNKLRAQGAQITGGRLVEKVSCNDAGLVSSVTTVDKGGEKETIPADVVVFAVGVNAMQKIVAASPLLAGRKDFTAFANLGAVDVLAVRLWLDRYVTVKNPSNVFAKFDSTTGGTFFDLTVLQQEEGLAAAVPSGGTVDEFGQGSVVEVDFYHASQLLPLSNDTLVQLCLHKYLAGCEPAYAACKVLDSSVLRFKGAVTLFGPGSHQHMPTTQTSILNVFIAGDWLKQGPGSHGARGLSQEKAYVTGLQAANAAAGWLPTQPRHYDMLPVPILPVEQDEVQFQVGKSLFRATRQTLQQLGLGSVFIGP